MRAGTAFLAAALVAAVPALPAAAQDSNEPRLALPLDCTLGDSCYIQNFVDHDPTPAYADFTCAGLTYDDHKGTDFGLPSLAEMQAGVTVRAAAPGIVAGLRDGMADTGYSKETAAAIKGRECGNGVVIDHGGGWVTQYCHMKRGSIAVSKGQRVETGAALGQVGLSGQTEFPHLHLSVRQGTSVVDPFDAGRRATCATGGDRHSLWQDTPAYVPGGLLGAGFSDKVPSYDAVKAGHAAAATLPTDAPALVVWGYAFGARAGDTLRLEISGPAGFAHAYDAVFDKAQAQAFRAAGKRLPATGWPAGVYAGTITLLRDGQPLDEHSTTVEIHR